jgi:hypothetical protein
VFELVCKNLLPAALLVRIFVILHSFFWASEGRAMSFRQHFVPTNRSTLKGGAWFPYVIGKLAPLEWWSYQESISEVKREEYPSGRSYHWLSRIPGNSRGSVFRCFALLKSRLVLGSTP